MLTEVSEYEVVNIATGARWTKGTMPRSYIEANYGPAPDTRVLRSYHAAAYLPEREARARPVRDLIRMHQEDLTKLKEQLLALYQ